MCSFVTFKINGHILKLINNIKGMLKIRNASLNPENLFKEISSLEFSGNVELSVNNIHRSEQEEEEPEDKERTIRRRRRF